MQLSRFVLAYRNVRPGEHVLYSVLEDRYIGVDDATLSAVARWKSGKRPRDGGERETQHVLLEEGFVVRGRSGDDARLRAHLLTASEGIPGTMLVTLMPTLACDLACTYCFQKEHPAFTKMSPSTEDATLAWILRQVDERGLRHLKVHYFGGEPLTRKDYCVRTANVLSVSMAARGGTFEWSVTTNGLGLDLPFAEAMLRCGDGSFKVTLDGDKETHDKMRVYRDGRGSFDRIFENLMAVAPHARIHVGGNFFPDQAASFEKLLDRIETSGLGAFLGGVNFKPIVDTQALGKGSCTGCSSSEESSTLVQLNKSIERRKLTGAQLGKDARDGTVDQLVGPCELHWKNSYTIDPDGNVYKCPAVAGLPGLEVAKVAQGGPEKIAPLLAQRPWEQCGDCPFMPVCMGGCLGGKYLKTRQTGEVSCKKELFEQSFRETVPGRYLAEFPEAEQSNGAAA
jgi:uncharacterized protein